MKRKDLKKIVLLFVVVTICYCFEQSILMQKVFSQEDIYSIKNADEALKYYINKFTPPPYPKRGALINTKERIIMEENVNNSDLKYLIFFPYLKRLLIIKSKQVTDEGLKYIENLTNIEYLNLWGTNITIKGLQKLSKLKKIKRLALDETNIVDDDLRIIAELFPELEALGIGGNKIKGPGIQYLKKLKLGQLGLDNTLISDETVKYFAGFKNCEISLHNTKVTAKGKAEIMRITESCDVSIKEGDLAPPKE